MSPTSRALYRGRPWTQVWLVLVLAMLAVQFFVPLLAHRINFSGLQVLELCLDLCVLVLRSLPTVDRWYERRDA